MLSNNSLFVVSCTKINHKRAVSILIHHQSKQQKDDEINKWTLNLLPKLFTRFNHAEFAPVCTYVFLISLGILTSSRSSFGVFFEHFFRFIGQ